MVDGVQVILAYPPAAGDRLMQNYCACHYCVARPLKILMYWTVHSAWVPDVALPPPSMEASGFSGARALL